MSARVFRFSDYHPAHPTVPPSYGEGEDGEVIVLPIIRIERGQNGSDLVRVVDVPKEVPFR